MEPFKNFLNKKAAVRISNALKNSYDKFDSDIFLRNIEKELEPLELKQRSVLIKSRLESILPSSPEESFRILQRALRKSEADQIGLSGFLVWPLTQYVADNGLKHFDISMTALYEMTKVFTSEFAIRPFLVAHEGKTINILEKWVKDENEHVRRLVSEGSRPLLPWGIRLEEFKKNPEKTWHLLDQLKADSSKYVQKSVANHINDHSKNHGDWLVKKLKTWQTRDQQSLGWIIRHGTRTLVKNGHVGALSLHGIKAVPFKKPAISLKNKNIKVGQSLEISCSLKNPLTKSISTIIDIEVLFLKSNGKHGPKVFKGKSFQMAPGETKKVELRVPIRKVTTRSYYHGKHGCTLVINGVKQQTLWFTLKT